MQDGGRRDPRRADLTAAELLGHLFYQPIPVSFKTKAAQLFCLYIQLFVCSVTQALKRNFKKKVTLAQIRGRGSPVVRPYADPPRLTIRRLSEGRALDVQLDS